MNDILSRFTVVLSRPSHPGNIGAAARAAKTMGIADLRLVAPKSFPDAQATALASGATDVLDAAKVFERLEDALADCVLAAGFTTRSRDLSHAPRSLRQAAPELLAAAAAGRIALVFGNETFGLTNEELGRCQALVTIPSNPAYGSLNLGAAVQVACYEIATSAMIFPQAAAPVPSPGAVHASATIEEIEALFVHWETAMVQSGFLDPQQPKRLMERMRRMLARGGLEREEVKFLRGMLAAFQKRMGA